MIGHTSHHTGMTTQKCLSLSLYLFIYLSIYLSIYLYLSLSLCETSWQTAAFSATAKGITWSNQIDQHLYDMLSVCVQKQHLMSQENIPLQTRKPCKLRWQRLFCIAHKTAC